MSTRSVMKIGRTIGVIWAILGITLLLGTAVLRVTPYAIEAVKAGMNALEWIALVVWSGIMLVAEGYKGFQKQYSPRVAARVWHLYNHGRGLDLVLAPLYSAGYYHAPRKRIITAWSITIGIALIVTVFRFVPQPYRGIIDSGVVLGLAYGLLWFYILTVRAFRSRSYPVDPEVVSTRMI